MTAAPNAYAVAARERKATAIEAVLVARGWDAGRAAAATFAERDAAADEAGVRAPSQDTWDLVVHLMADGRPS